MKQYITQEQLHELEEYAIYRFVIDKLNLFWISEPDYEWIAKQTTIGKMIEIIKSNKANMDTFEIKSPIGLFDMWIIWHGRTYPQKYEHKELADALWEITKTIL